LTEPTVQPDAPGQIEKRRQCHHDQNVELVVIQTVDVLLNEDRANEYGADRQRNGKPHHAMQIQMRVDSVTQNPSQKQTDFKGEKAISEARAVKSVGSSHRA